MTDTRNTSAQHTDASDLETLHEKVNAMLDLPAPGESDAFPMPMEVDVNDRPVPTDLQD